MLKPNRFLSLDIGASTLKLAEFTVSKSGVLTLNRFNYAETTADPAQQEQHSQITADSIIELMRETGIKRAPVALSLPGQSIFSRFVKLPAVEETKVVQIIRYEAQQHVPFPMEEVVWDYQLIGGGGGEDLEVVLVAIKSEILDELTAPILQARLPLRVADVSPMALYNAVRYSYPEWFAAENPNKESVMVLDIGARTSNLVFVEENRIFSRSIPIAGNVITQTIASELQISFEEAEALKREKGMVGLGGAYEDPPDETQARLAKIIRNVITHLHADVNRSINFYRTQRGGSPPTRLLLSGGASIMGYLDRFFSETLRIPVEYFNPFRNVQLAPHISREELSTCAHFFGEVVGAALRRTTECPIQVSLIPPEVLQKRVIKQRIPYLIGTGVAVFLTLQCWNFYYSRISREVRQAAETLSGEVQRYERMKLEIERQRHAVREEENRLTRLTDMVESRTAWPRILAELNGAIATDDEMWFISLTPVYEGGVAPPLAHGGPLQGGAMLAAPQAPTGKMVVVKEVRVAGRAIANRVNLGSNYQKIEKFLKRLAGDEPGSTYPMDQTMFVVDKSTFDAIAIKLPEPNAKSEVEKYSFSFSIPLKLKNPVGQ